VRTALCALVLAGAACLLGATSAQAVRVHAVSAAAEPHLLSFDLGAPGTILSDVPVTGVGAGEEIQGIDLRPATGEVLMLTKAGGVGRLYRLNTATGAASAPIVLAADPTDLTSPYSGLGTQFMGIDVNPVPDRVRAVGDGRLNLRINPTNGLTITDDDINPGTPSIADVAYANPFAGTASTTLYDYEYLGDRLMLQNPPNNGTVTEIGPSTVIAQSLPLVGLDITTTNVALFSTKALGSARFYIMNLTTGAATLIGPIGDGATDIRDITATENLFRVQSAPAAGSEGGTAAVTVVRDEPHAAATIDYSTAAGTATADTDYTPVSGTLTFRPGQTEQVVQVQLAADGAAEPTESLTFSIATPRGTLVPEGSSATLSGPSSTSVLIGDNPPSAQPPSPLPGRCANAQTGSSADDLLQGGAAGDRLTGRGGGDAVLGAAGDDCLGGGPGDDFLSGGAGNDNVRGDAGSDILSGGPGADVISTGSGSNLVNGGTGADRIVAANRVRETIRCGGGRDRATVDRRDRVKGCERVRRR
jgi:Ca2+-binding RTX toxin-like protein